MHLKTSLYYRFNELPEYKEIEEELQRAKVIYSDTITKLEARIKEIDECFKLKRDTARKNTTFTFSCKKITVNEFGKHYTIERTADNSLEGDVEFNKPVIYGSFKIINNVFISTGSGYQLLTTGTILSDKIISDLDSKIVSEEFIKLYETTRKM